MSCRAQVIQLQGPDAVATLRARPTTAEGTKPCRSVPPTASALPNDIIIALAEVQTGSIQSAHAGSFIHLGRDQQCSLAAFEALIAAQAGAIEIFAPDLEAQTSRPGMSRVTWTRLECAEKFQMGTLLEQGTS